MDGLSRPTGFTAAATARNPADPHRDGPAGGGGRSAPPPAAGQHGPGPVKPGGSRRKASVSGGIAAGQPVR